MSLEKDRLQKALTMAFDEFIAALSSFDAKQVNHKPSPARWTPAQVAIHIIKATDGVPDHSTQPAEREPDAMLAAIRPWWEDLNQKFTSPEALQPDELPHAKVALLSALDRVRQKDMTILATQDLTALCMDFALPEIGHLTRYEWLWFIQMHLKRHTFQLKNMVGVV